MRTASKTQQRRGFLAAALVSVASLLVNAGSVRALELDEEGAMRLGLRAYNAVRLGTQTIGDQEPFYFPRSGAGHVRQHRYFLQLDLEHDLLQYTHSGWGLARLLGWLDPNVLKYAVTYRGEREGIYEYGPSEYEDYRNELLKFRRKVPAGGLAAAVGLRQKLERKYINDTVSRLHRIGDSRNQLFYAYLDVEKGPAFLRVGRQVLAWGETDIFRLLDNINPLDDSFGGFFIPLDERRMPLDMIRGSWNFGSVGPLSDTFFEAFVAQGNRVAQDPGIPNGSPWRPGGMGYPNPILQQITVVPDYWDVRWGGRLVTTWNDVTFTLAQYWTYFDIPTARFILPGCPRDATGACTGTATPTFSNPIYAVAEHPRVPITGASATFPLEKFYSIVRTEIAYFNGEPFNRQGTGNPEDNVFGLGTPQANRLRDEKNTEGGLNPFVYQRFLDLARQNPIKGTTLRLDTFNVAIGLDVNRYIRFLNPHQTFFITTQMFYKHVFDSPGDLVLPVLHRNIGVNSNAPVVGVDGPAPGLGQGCVSKKGVTRNCALQPRLLHLDDDRFLHTLLITTSYRGGRIVPQLGMFYDWQGAYVLQPGVTFIRDPFRFVVDYTGVFGATTGQFGAVIDRDNVRFQVEYVF
ncbi:MAG TPA: DUF1302 family protein [Candidatus Limnocylindria bacterium]|nr:DUF1302 family protein [Candidatus Limnocylindria bacterium]